MPSGCHAPQSTPAPPAVLGSALSPPLFYQAVLSYKTRSEPLSPPDFPILSPRDAELAATLPCRNPPRLLHPAQIPLPTASLPPPLAPRPDPVQLPALLRRNFSNLVPPSPEPPADDLTVDDLLPLLPQPNLVRESLPHFPLVLVRALLARVHRSFAGNAGDPTRPPPFLAAGRVPPPPVEHIPSQTVP
jgi:hypothetical protein